MKYKRGFTLIELLIVMSLLAALAMLTISFFRSQIFKANDSKRKANLNRIAQALEEYEKDFDCYPANISNLQPYLESVPMDPVFKSQYGYERDITSACAKWYKLYSKLENTKDSAYKLGIGPAAGFNYMYASPNSP